MKVIDIMQKIANGEKIRFRVIDDIEYYCEENGLLHDEYGEEVNWLIDTSWLNVEVEIIEENKKIEKIDLSEWSEITYNEDWKLLTYDFNRNSNLFVDKINEIIEQLDVK